MTEIDDFFPDDNEIAETPQQVPDDNEIAETPQQTKKSKVTYTPLLSVTRQPIHIN